VYAEDQIYTHIVITVTLDQKKRIQMKNKIKSVVCKIKGHALKFAGQCPFTGSSYEYCERCEAMITLDEATE
jgi:hypothetical protein